MNKMIESLSSAFQFILKDKIIMTLSSFPVMIGGALYYFLGSWVLNNVLVWGKQWISERMSDGFGVFIYWILAALLWIVFFFIVNWTFVLVVSLIASPFNDAISGRVLKKLQGQATDSLPFTIKRLFSKSLFTIFNELKKISFIVLMTTLAFLISMIPVLAPISIVISAILLSVEFLDYSWSRKELKFSECLSDTRRFIFPYGISGGAFTFLMAIPIVNLFFLPIGVIYYTVLHHNLNIKG